ncbi:MAG: guanylate kinase [Myxococcales bacterium]|nr:guanylate kinase [Myxococcales bacterium]MCZ6714017.1 guanylate kinase [Deltaproteobacteria bacterium]TDJ06507.1 MAG: guanylate kinase [Deltaproteobacteria bacterium]
MSEGVPLQPVRQGIPFVISGPSGAGKTSILRRVLECDPGVRFSVSHTTRAPRSGEIEGQDYFFVAEERFRQLVDQDAFLEWADYQDNLYGTSREAVAGPTREGFDLILEVEVQGARQLRERGRGAVFVFLIPPSLDVLEQRLRSRGSDDEDVVRKRLERAREELREIHGYRYVVVNADMEQAVRDFLHIIAACRLEREKVLPLWSDMDFG